MKYPLLKLWLLLLTAFGIFVFLATFDNLSIFGHQLAKIEIRQVNIDESFGKFSIEALPVTSCRQINVDTLPKTILFIGDSMLEGLSPRFAAYAEKNGHKLYTVIWYGSTTKKWGESDRITGYVKRFSPDLVVVCVGGNELFVRNIGKERAKWVDAMLQDIGDIPSLWIGPPNWKEDTGINQLLSDKVGVGRFFLSKNLDLDRASDGAHPTREAASVWMDTIASWMENTSSCPFLMKKPDRMTARAERTFVLTPKD